MRLFLFFGGPLVRRVVGGCRVSFLKVAFYRAVNLVLQVLGGLL